MITGHKNIIMKPDSFHYLVLIEYLEVKTYFPKFVYLLLVFFSVHIYWGSGKSPFLKVLGRTDNTS